MTTMSGVGGEPKTANDVNFRASGGAQSAMDDNVFVGCEPITAKLVVRQFLLSA